MDDPLTFAHMGLGSRKIRIGRPIASIVLALLCVFGKFSLRKEPSIMEARNLISARETLRTGNWLFPTLWGNPRLRKPPMPIWLSALSSMALGSGRGEPRDLLAMRVPSLLATIFACLMIGLMARSRLGPMGFPLGFSLSLTTWGFLKFSLAATWDVYGLAFALAGIYFLEKGLHRENPRPFPSITAAGIFLGLSILSKGPVFLYSVSLPWLISALLIPGYRKGFRWSRLAAVLAAGVVLGASWWVAAFFHFHHAHEIYRQEVSAWGEKHTQEIFYYSYSFLFVVSPWALHFLASLWDKVSGKDFKDNALLWFLAGFVLLSIVPEKKVRYTISMIPPGVLMISRALLEFEGLGKWAKGFIKAHAFVAVAGSLAAGSGLAVLACILGKWWICLLGIPFIALGILLLKARKELFSVLCYTIAAMFLCFAVIFPLRNEWKGTRERFFDFRDFRAQIPHESIYTWGMLHPTIMWELDPEGVLGEGSGMPEAGFHLVAYERDGNPLSGFLSGKGRRFRLERRLKRYGREKERYVVFKVHPRSVTNGKGD